MPKLSQASTPEKARQYLIHVAPRIGLNPEIATKGEIALAARDAGYVITPSIRRCIVLELRDLFVRADASEPALHGDGYEQDEPCYPVAALLSDCTYGERDAALEDLVDLLDTKPGCTWEILTVIRKIRGYIGPVLEEGGEMEEAREVEGAAA